MIRRNFLKGMTLVAGVVSPKVSWPIEPKSIVPTYQRPLDSLGYIRVEFFDGEEELFEVDESWIKIERIPLGFSVSFREVEYTADRKCVITSASVLTVGGDVIRKSKLECEIYMAPGDRAHLSINFYATFT